MTAERQESYRRDLGRALFAVLVAVFALFGPNPAAQGATTQRIVTNRYSGLAIEGFDAVAYFTDAQAIRGVADYEAAESGAVWRFQNASNRDAFAANPEIYGPQFGGYDPIDVARGIAYAGNPRFFVVTGQRLYLFAREESRDSFAANPARYLKDAVERWPAVQKTLAQ
jgi:hypothetical protein